MTPDNVYSAVCDIANITHDDERAHSLEDDLYEAVLRAIADGTATDPAECARQALTTKQFIFARWCA